MSVRASVCALDCPDTCAMLVHIDDSGRASKLQGDPAHPVTQGFLCGKVTQYLEREYHPDRLRFPMRRTGARGSGEFQRISWDQALDEVAEGLRRASEQFGSESVLPYSYAGTMGMLNGSGMDRRFFHRMGASRLDRTICSTAGGAALTASQGVRIGMDPHHFADARLIIAWGANVLGTNPHLWPFIVEARRRGAKFYVIDPIRNRTGQAADRIYQLHPGSDVALALGMIHVILRDGLQDREYIARYTDGFRELEVLARDYTPAYTSECTGLPASDIEELAREYATTQPAAIRVNYGLQRSERGGSAVRAVAALPVLTGAWRHKGGGMQLSTTGAFAFDWAALQRPDLQHVSLGREARLINMSRLGNALNDVHDPPVKALVVYNSNPAAIAPNQSRVLAGLRREDLFTVVIEQFKTDTADFADVVLPATTFLEHTDLYLAYGHYHLQLARPALPAEGEARSNVEIFRQLAKRMGFNEPCFDDTEDDMIRACLTGHSPYLRGITLERLEAERSVRLNLGDGDFLPFAAGEFPTSTGRFQFGAESWQCDPPVESRRGDQQLRSRFPLEFVSSKNDDSMNSTFGHRDRVDAQTGTLAIHESDAAERHISHGGQVRAFNDRGAVLFKAVISDSVRPGVVRARAVRWNKRSPEAAGVNQLTGDRLTDIGGSPAFYSCMIQVEAVAD